MKMPTSAMKRRKKTPFRENREPLFSTGAIQKLEWSSTFLHLALVGRLVFLKGKCNQAVQRNTLKPTFLGQTHEVNHLVTQVGPAHTLEHESNEAPVLAKTFQKAFAQTHNLKQGIKKF